MLGIWSSFVEMEESISLPELEAILEAAHEKEHRNMKFQAALKGIDLDKDKKDSAKERFEAIKRRVEARQSGKNAEASELEDVFGLDVVIE